MKKYRNWFLLILGMMSITFMAGCSSNSNRSQDVDSKDKDSKEVQQVSETKNVKSKDDNHSKEMSLPINKEDVHKVFSLKLISLKNIFNKDISEPSAILQDLDQDGVEELLVIARGPEETELKIQVYEYDQTNDICFLANEIIESGIGSGAFGSAQYSIINNGKGEFLLENSHYGSNFEYSIFMSYSEQGFAEVAKYEKRTSKISFTIKGSSVSEQSYTDFITAYSKKQPILSTEYAYTTLTDYTNGGSDILKNLNVGTISNDLGITNGIMALSDENIKHLRTLNRKELTDKIKDISGTINIGLFNAGEDTFIDYSFIGYKPDNENIQAIRFFPGCIVLGLNFTETPEEVIKKLGDPINSGVSEADGGYFIYYKYETYELWVEFDDNKKMRSILLKDPSN